MAKTIKSKYTNDDIVVYTGYNKDEIINEISILKDFHNINIQFIEIYKRPLLC